jgi:DNA recombination protein RmuC
MGGHVSKLGRSLDGAVKAYNETVGSLERTVLPQARKFEQHGITTIEAAELQPVERQTRALAAPELAADEQPPLEVLPGDAHAA